MQSIRLPQMKWNDSKRLLRLLTDIHVLLLTKAYNRVLMEDVESFIRQHMKVWSADRTVVELEIARAEAEMLQC